MTVHFTFYSCVFMLDKVVERGRVYPDSLSFIDFSSRVCSWLVSLTPPWTGSSWPAERVGGSMPRCAHQTSKVSYLW